MKGPIQITAWSAAYKGHQHHWCRTQVQPNSGPSLPKTLSCDLMMSRDRENTSPLAVPVFSQHSFCILVAYKTECQKRLSLCHLQWEENWNSEQQHPKLQTTPDMKWRMDRDSMWDTLQSSAVCKPMHFEYCTKLSKFPSFHLFQWGFGSLTSNSGEGRGKR